MNGDFSFLTDLGFSINEAKVYLSLVENGAMNGYEIAKASGVSRSLVYGVIERLSSKGYVLPIKGDSSFYEALPWSDLIRGLKREGEGRLRRAEEALSRFSGSGSNRDFAYNLVGYGRFLEKARELINEAKREISLSIWPEELETLRDELSSAMSRGVKVYAFSFGRLSLPGAVIHSYALKDADSLFPYRRDSFVADGEAALIGEYRGDDTISIYSRNHVFVSVVTDEIVLNTICYHFLKAKGSLGEVDDVSSFLRVHEAMRRELQISTNIGKNLMVYDFQTGKRERDGD